VTRLRRVAHALVVDAGFAWQTRVLPRRVALLQIRARLRARRSGDLFSLTSATRPADLARLLKLAQGRHGVVELGTGTAWTAVALVAADRGRRVTSLDPVARPERERYLALLDRDQRARLELVQAPGATGPRSLLEIDFLFIDSSHERADVIAELRAWEPALRPGALVVFDDYVNPVYPGVAEAVAELGLTGTQSGALFVHEHRPSGGGRVGPGGAAQ
jgi:predicted O-methyltransferase YrrM